MLRQLQQLLTQRSEQCRLPLGPAGAASAGGRAGGNAAHPKQHGVARLDEVAAAEEGTRGVQVPPAALHHARAGQHAHVAREALQARPQPLHRCAHARMCARRQRCHSAGHHPLALVPVTATADHCRPLNHPAPREIGLHHSAIAVKRPRPTARIHTCYRDAV